MRSFLFVGAFLLAGAVGAQAADLIVEEAPAVADTSFVNSNIYFQLLGGPVQDLDITYFNGGEESGGEGTNYGFGLAATAGVVVLDGLSLEADVLYTKRDYVDSSESSYSTFSLMANAKYTIDLNETFSVYGAVGLGYIWAVEDWYGTPYKYNGIGYQVIAGLGARLTDSISAVAEYRFQDTLDRSNYDGSGDYGMSVPVSTVLAGLKLSF